MNIVIVESPAKAKTIEKYLGKNYRVLASYGHVRDLPSKDGSVDPDHDFAMHYRVPPQSEKVMKEIAKAVSGAEAVYLATDLDREGEAISWHVLEELKKRVKGFEKLAVHRIEFSEITKSAIQNAVANPRKLSDTLVGAQQARRALDYLVGFNLSPVLWRKVRGGLSAGRVQSVALRLICEREGEIEAFKAEEYWTIEGLFKTPAGEDLTARLTHWNGTKLEKFSITDQATAQKAETELREGTYTVANIQKKDTQRRPQPPFITSTLQIDASRRLGYSAKKIMSLAQRLYEAGHITYMRTDSVNFSNEALDGVRSEIGKAFGVDYLPAKPNFYKTKTQNAQEAHEAIRPTNFSKRGSELGLEADQQKLYELIWKRAVASQMAPAKLAQTTLDISGVHGTFRASGSVVMFPGFMKAYEVDRETGEENGNLLPPVSKGEELGLKKLSPEQHFTEPPPRYSEATLVKTLEEKGIGRPSTYASIISTIQDRGYVRLEKRRFFPEDVGRVVSKFLVEHFPRYVDVGFTAEMEEELDAISRGEKEWKPMLRDFWAPFKSLVDEKVVSVKKSEVTSEATGEPCPQCKEGELVIRLGRYGRFKGCNRYPECRYIENLNDNGEKVERPAPKSTGITCPKCGENDIVEKTSRRGKVFYGCGGYPKCNYALWNKPVAESCPQCNNSFITVKETKRMGTIKICPQEDCGWQDPPYEKPAKKGAAKRKAS